MLLLILEVTYRVEKHPQTVHLGDDADQSAIIRDRQAATFPLQQQVYGLYHVNIGPDPHHVFRHALLDRGRRQLYAISPLVSVVAGEGDASAGHGRL